MPQNKQDFQKQKERIDQIWKIIKRDADILAVLDYYGLQPNKYNKYLCPFHDDHEPSLYIGKELNESGQPYKFACYSCNTRGNHYKFVELMEQKLTGRKPSHLDILKKLDEICHLGIDFSGVENVNPAKEDFRTTAYTPYQQEILKQYEAIQDYFAYNLGTNKKAVEYIENRHVDEATCKYFGLGYCPDDLPGYLNKKLKLNNDFESFISTGLLKESDAPRFPLRSPMANRITIPLHDEYGHIIAYAGRTLDSSSKAKYLNLQNSHIFKKENTLYNYHNARNAVNKAHREAKKTKSPLKRQDPVQVILAEGYFDVMGAFRMGKENAVAAMGINFSDKQLSMIKNLNCEILYARDNDNAGIRASLSLCETLINQGIPVSVLDWTRIPALLPEQNHEKPLKDLWDLSETEIDPAKLFKCTLDGKQFLFENAYLNQEELTASSLRQILNEIQANNLIQSEEDKVLFYESALKRGANKRIAELTIFGTHNLDSEISQNSSGLKPQSNMPSDHADEHTVIHDPGIPDRMSSVQTDNSEFALPQTKDIRDDAKIKVIPLPEPTEKTESAAAIPDKPAFNTAPLEPEHAEPFNHPIDPVFRLLLSDLAFEAIQDETARGILLNNPHILDAAAASIYEDPKSFMKDDDSRFQNLESSNNPEQSFNYDKILNLVDKFIDNEIHMQEGNIPKAMDHPDPTEPAGYPGTQQSLFDFGMSDDNSEDGTRTEEKNSSVPLNEKTADLPSDQSPKESIPEQNASSKTPDTSESTIDTSKDPEKEVSNAPSTDPLDQCSYISNNLKCHYHLSDTQITQIQKELKENFPNPQEILDSHQELCILNASSDYKKLIQADDIPGSNMLLLALQEGLTISDFQSFDYKVLFRNKPIKDIPDQYKTPDLKHLRKILIYDNRKNRLNMNIKRPNKPKPDAARSKEKQKSQEKESQKSPELPAGSSSSDEIRSIDEPHPIRPDPWRMKHFKIHERYIQEHRSNYLVLNFLNGKNLFIHSENIQIEKKSPYLNTCIISIDPKFQYGSAMGQEIINELENARYRYNEDYKLEISPRYLMKREKDFSLFSIPYTSHTEWFQIPNNSIQWKSQKDKKQEIPFVTLNSETFYKSSMGNMNGEDIYVYWKDRMSKSSEYSFFEIREEDIRSSSLTDAEIFIPGSDRKSYISITKKNAEWSEEQNENGNILYSFNLTNDQFYTTSIGVKNGSEIKNIWNNSSSKEIGRKEKRNTKNYRKSFSL